MQIDKTQKFSIITPCLNAEEYIEQAIISVIEQNYSHFEHIIVDGKSNDGTKNILQKYHHLIWISGPDKGQSDAMNKGFNLSTGEIIGYLNADDYYLPGTFEAVAPFFNHNADFVVGKVKVLRENGSFFIDDPSIELSHMLKWWENNFCLNPVGYFYKRKVQTILGGYNIANHYSMDYEFLLKAASQFEFTKINRVLGVFRSFPGTKTYNSRKDYSFVDHFEFCDKYLHLFKQSYIQSYISQRNIHIKNYTEDRIIIQILENIKQFNLTALFNSLIMLIQYSQCRIFYRFGRFCLRLFRRSINHSKYGI